MRLLDQTKRHQKYFEDICEIPHGSRNTEKLCEYLMDFAKERGLWAKRDSVGNIIIIKPSSKGYEQSAPVILQAHIDMVCAKDSDVDHDFEHDGLKLEIDEKGWLHAKGTTLGADDGVGVATMLALLDDKELEHPMLECVFTNDEEIGMIGVAALDISDLIASRLISLDATGENVTLISSAGGLKTHISKKILYTERVGVIVTLTVFGLKGGHSGMDIQKQRGNSIKIMGNVLKRLQDDNIEFNIVSINGGMASNAIPRRCECTLACSETDFERMVELAEETGASLLAQYKDSAPDASLKWGRSKSVGCMFTRVESDMVINLLNRCPNGVYEMSKILPDYVLTSGNLGQIFMDGDTLKIVYSLRGAEESSMMELNHNIKEMCKELEFECFSDGLYPGWPLSGKSPLREALAQTMKRCWGKQLTELAVHAGTECSYFAEKINGFEAVTIGPFMENVHTPQEKLDIASFDRVYNLLVEFIKDLK